MPTIGAHNNFTKAIQKSSALRTIIKMTKLKTIIKFSIRFKHIIRLNLIILKFMFIGQYDNILQFISLYIVGFCSNLLYILFDAFWLWGINYGPMVLKYTDPTSFLHNPFRKETWNFLMILSGQYDFITEVYPYLIYS